MHFCTENVRPILVLRKGIKRNKVNQKPNMSSCLTLSEAVLMKLSGIKQFIPKNVGLIVCLFKLFWLLLLSNISNFRNVALSGYSKTLILRFGLKNTFNKIRD